MQSLLPNSSVQFQFQLFSLFTVLLGHLLPAVRGFVLQELPLYSSMALFDDNIDYNNNNDGGGSFEVVDKKQEEELAKIEKAIEEVGASSILQPVFPLENGGVGEQAAEKRKHHHHHVCSLFVPSQENRI
jgi:hypothetical protein